MSTTRPFGSILTLLESRGTARPGFAGYTLHRFSQGARMPRETWGTYAVDDHVAPRPFVADVMLFDRLVMPVPPPRGEITGAWDEAAWAENGWHPEHDRFERSTWEDEGWSPDRLDDVIDILGEERVRLVNWNHDRRTSWRSRWEAGKKVGRDTQPWAFQQTRAELTAGLPPGVTGVESITTFPSLAAVQEQLGLRLSNDDGEVLPGGTVTAVLARRFLLPDEPEYEDLDTLRAAVELSSDPDYSRHRRSMWRWVREFYLDDVVTDQEAVELAVEEFQSLIDDAEASVRRSRIRTASRWAFTIGSVAVSLFGGPLAPLGLAGAGLSIGAHATDQVLRDPEEQRSAQLALLHDPRRDLLD